MRYFLSNALDHKYAVPVSKRELWYTYVLDLNEGVAPPEWAIRLDDRNFTFRDPLNNKAAWDTEDECTYRYVIEGSPGLYVTSNKYALGPFHRAKMYQKSSDAIKAMKRWRDANLVVVEVVVA